MTIAQGSEGAHVPRPKRLRLPDFQGKMFTLESGAMAYDMYCIGSQEAKAQEGAQGQRHIILGTAGFYGVDFLQQALPSEALLHPQSVVYVLECPEFAQVAAKDAAAEPSVLPSHWEYIQENDIPHFLADNTCTVLWWYKQNMRLFPTYWSKVLGQVLAVKLWENADTSFVKAENSHAAPPKKDVILLGCKMGQLLEQELSQAFSELGFEVLAVREPLTMSHCTCVQQALQESRVRLFFSLNLQGLDSGGQDFALLRALGIPVALWFVDNPWHVLAALRLPWWKQASLLLTDASFMPGLRQEGAENIWHVPLATAQHMWQGKARVSEYLHNKNSAIYKAQEAQCVFVGRAAFPQKKSFFAAARVPQDLWQKAQHHLHMPMGSKPICESVYADIPHFHWWQEQLGCRCLWPGSAVRQVGLGAEQSAQYQRMQWLQGLLDMHVAVFGHAEGWKELLPMASPHIFHDDVDYYGELAPLYGAAPAVLNVTSLLLPAGLTQRHFDVWAAGGFLWTNATPGLAIFPKELVQPVAFTHVHALRKAMRDLSPSAKEALSLGWQEILRTEHSYTKRMAFVLECIL